MRNKLQKNAMRNNNGLGMKWFNFFYKFSIPVGMVLTLLSCVSSFILAFRDDMIYIDYAVIQLIHFVLSSSIFISFRRSKSEGIRSYPIRLYYLTIIFIVYFALIEIWLNVYSSFVCIPFVILNIIYFNKRKSMFKD